MKTVLDRNTREELISRIHSLNENAKALWGKMNIYEMLKHCSKWDDMIMGRIQVKPMFPGKLFGK